MWRYSFSGAETTLLDSCVEPSSCCKQVFRMLKDLKKTLQLEPLSSYHLKTILLYECEANPHPYQWSWSSLRERFISLLCRLENCLFSFNCPHYFIPSLNLLQSFQLQMCRYLAAKIRLYIMNQYGIQLVHNEHFIVN